MAESNLAKGWIKTWAAYINLRKVDIVFAKRGFLDDKAAWVLRTVSQVQINCTRSGWQMWGFTETITWMNKLG